MNTDKDKKDLNQELDNFLNNEKCNTEECKIKGSKELVERVNKTFITEDGRQLLF